MTDDALAQHGYTKDPTIITIHYGNSESQAEWFNQGWDHALTQVISVLEINHADAAELLREAFKYTEQDYEEETE